MRGIDEDQPHDVVRVGGGIEAGDQAAEGMAGQHVGTGDRGRGQQRVQVSDHVARVAGHGHGIAATAVFEVEDRARAVVGTDPSEGGHPGSTAVCSEPGGRPTVSQVSASLPAPASRITVGLPWPRHSSQSRRPPPMSTRPAKSPLAAMGEAAAGVD